MSHAPNTVPAALVAKVNQGEAGEREHSQCRIGSEPANIDVSRSCLRRKGFAKALRHRAGVSRRRGKATGAQESGREKGGLTVSSHSRQCVGCTFTGECVFAFTQPCRTRRHGNTSEWTPSRSITARSRSRSNGAVAIDCHSIFKSSDCLASPASIPID